MNKDLTRLPNVNEQIKFFDDGKTSMCRRYYAYPQKIIPFWTAVIFHPKMVFNWFKEVKCCSWLYAKKTDYFIIAKIPRFTDFPVIFVRTQKGTWFSIDYPRIGMSGALDVDDKIWNNLIKDFGYEGMPFYEPYSEKLLEGENKND